MRASTTACVHFSTGDTGFQDPQETPTKPLARKTQPPMEGRVGRNGRPSEHLREPYGDTRAHSPRLCAIATGRSLRHAGGSRHGCFGALQRMAAPSARLTVVLSLKCAYAAIPLASRGPDAAQVGGTVPDVQRGVPLPGDSARGNWAPDSIDVVPSLRTPPFVQGRTDHAVNDAQPLMPEREAASCGLAGHAAATPHPPAMRRSGKRSAADAGSEFQLLGRLGTTAGYLDASSRATRPASASRNRNVAASVSRSARSSTAQAELRSLWLRTWGPRHDADGSAAPSLITGGPMRATLSHS